MKKHLLLMTALLPALMQAWGQEVVASGTCGAEGDNLTWTLTEDGTLTISGQGDMADFSPAVYNAPPCPWRENKQNIKVATVQEGVTSIGGAAFCKCGTLAAVALPGSLTTIGDEAFTACSSLLSISIPQGVTSIGEAAFSYCSALTSITIPEKVTNIGYATFRNCSGLVSVDIPEGVTSIGDNVFEYCTNLPSIHLPNSVTDIGPYAFYECCNLTSVNIPDGVTIIWTSTFQGCSKLISIEFPERLTKIGLYAFSGCTKLASVSIPRQVNYIEDYAFSYCVSLTSLTIPGSVMDIGIEAFYNCTGLTSVTIDRGVMNIGARAFDNCENLTSVTIPNSVKSIGYDAFFNTAIYNEENNWNKGGLYIDQFLIDGKRAGKVCDILPGTKLIADRAFHGCTGLTSVTFPPGIKSIGAEAFYFCSGLDSLIIGEGLEEIRQGAFLNCDNLRSIDLPSTTKVIGNGFSGCLGLKEVTIRAIAPPEVDFFAFGYASDIPIYVPSKSIEAYRTAKDWYYYINFLPLSDKPVDYISSSILTGGITIMGREVQLPIGVNTAAQVYDMAGRCVLSTTERNFTLPQGLYVIKIGCEAVKISVR